MLTRRRSRPTPQRCRSCGPMSLPPSRRSRAGPSPSTTLNPCLLYLPPPLVARNAAFPGAHYQRGLFQINTTFSTGKDTPIDILQLTSNEIEARGRRSRRPACPGPSHRPRPRRRVCPGDLTPWTDTSPSRVLIGATLIVAPRRMSLSSLLVPLASRTVTAASVRGLLVVASRLARCPLEERTPQMPRWAADA